MSMVKKSVYLCLVIIMVAGSALAGTAYSCYNETDCKNVSSCTGDMASMDGCKIQCYNFSGTFGMIYLAGSASCGVGGTGTKFKVQDI